MSTRRRKTKFPDVPPSRLREAGLGIAVGTLKRQIQKNFMTFAQWVMSDEIGQPLDISDFHRVCLAHVEACWAKPVGWQKPGRILEPYRHAAIIGPFGHGKCQPIGSPVQLADGSREKIENVHEMPVIAFDENESRYVSATARSFPNGRRNVRSVSLFSGRRIEVTDEHPFFTVSGWVEASNLKVGDYVATVRTYPSMGNKPLLDGEARLLGYLIADGSLRQTSVGWTKYDEETVRSCLTAARILGFVPVRDRRVDTHFYRLCGAVRWAKHHEIFGKKAEHKVVPTAVFTAPNDQVAEFLAAYFEGDGSVVGPQTIEFYSVNHTLLEGVQSLLCRFGIVSRIRRKRGRYKGEIHLSWRLTIGGGEMIELFRGSIPVLGPKGRRIRDLDTSSRNANEDGVPLAYRRLLTKSTSWHKDHTGVSLDQNSKWTTNRDTIRKAAIAEGNPKLLSLVSPAVTWERVVSIEEIGERETYGLEVDGVHTYVSGDVVVHNSIWSVVGRIAWEIGNNPGLRIALVCQNDDKARERVMAVSALMKTRRYRWAFPEVREVDAKTAKETGQTGKWTQSTILLKRPGQAIDPTLQASGVLTSGTGGRKDLIFFDDVVDQRNAIDEPTLRERVIRNFESVWTQRLEPHGRMFLTGNIWHEADLHHRIMDKPGWSLLKIYVSDALDRLEMEVYNPPPNYPIPRR